MTDNGLLFEGTEKRLEFSFSTSTTCSKGMRNISYQTWSCLLVKAKCSILHSITNEMVDAYLLSESSLFVYPFSVILKTCGTTIPLTIVSDIIDLANSLNLPINYLKYSHCPYKFTQLQPPLYQSFQSEIKQLASIISPQTKTLILGSEQWFIYYLIWQADQFKPLLEISLVDLNPSSMKYFCLPSQFTSPLDCATQLGLTHLHGLTSDHLIVDPFQFDPCGFSLNAIINDIYYTIHITPELNCSFVSFESNVDPSVYQLLIHQIITIFQPNHFTILSSSLNDLSLTNYQLLTNINQDLLTLRSYQKSSLSY